MSGDQNSLPWLLHPTSPEVKNWMREEARKCLEARDMQGAAKAAANIHSLSFRSKHINQSRQKFLKENDSIRNSLTKAEELGVPYKDDIMEFAWEGDIIEKLKESIEPDWTVVQLTVLSNPVMDGDEREPQLLLTRISHNAPPLVLHIPSPTHKGKPLLFSKKWQKLQETNMVINSSNSTRDKHTEKLKKEICFDLNIMLRDMEEVWLDSWMGVFLLGKPLDRRLAVQVKAMENFLSKPLHTLNSKGLHEIFHQLLWAADSLTKESLTKAISAILGSSEVDGAVDQLLYRIDQMKDRLPKAAQFQSVARGPVILVLDEIVQALPWESIPMLKEQPICRAPCLHYIALRGSQHYTINSAKAYYLINPSRDLPGVTRRMTKYMEKHPNWKGLVEEEPSEEQLRDVLASFDLFLYCGHGSGTKFLPSIEVQRMECRALALLFGCSSGKLVQYGKKVEPHGVAYSYLLAGSPGVLGALCVVTDVDTDLITQAFLDTWLSGNVDLLSSLVKARKVAKSPFNAAACIFYGLPSISLLS